MPAYLRAGLAVDVLGRGRGGPGVCRSTHPFKHSPLSPSHAMQSAPNGAGRMARPQAPQPEAGGDGAAVGAGGCACRHAAGGGPHRRHEQGCSALQDVYGLAQRRYPEEGEAKKLLPLLQDGEGMGRSQATSAEEI